MASKRFYALPRGHYSRLVYYILVCVRPIVMLILIFNSNKTKIMYTNWYTRQNEQSKSVVYDKSYTSIEYVCHICVFE